MISLIFISYIIAWVAISLGPVKCFFIDFVCGQPKERLINNETKKKRLAVDCFHGIILAALVSTKAMIFMVICGKVSISVFYYCHAMI